MDDPGWRWEGIDGLRLLRCSALDSIPGLTHAFSSRIDSEGDDFDLGPAEGEAPAVVARRRRFMQAAGFGKRQPAILRQVHRARIVDAHDAAFALPSADGVFLDEAMSAEAPVPAVRSADCVAILLAARNGSAVAALHGGWRGVAGGIGAGGVARFLRAGTPAAELIAVLGPAILGCCYDVGAEVARELEASCGDPSLYVRRSRSGALSVDLHAAARSQLIGAGVKEGSIHAAPFCTRCRNDLFFSFRAEGDRCGRSMAAVGRAAGP